MAVRKIVEIDEEKCDGCGLCVPACAEGAIQIIDNKAKVVSETYCDGLGACLGECPQNAITIVEREAPDFNEEAVRKHLSALKKEELQPFPAAVARSGGCPGSAIRQFSNSASGKIKPASVPIESQLRHWPVQLMLVPPQAPFLRNADILICADCVPFTIPDFHSRFLAGRSLVVGCPKLDNLQYYYDKLKDIFRIANPQRLTVVKMEVPCCNGIAEGTIKARNETAPEIPLDIYTLGIRGGSFCENIPARTVMQKTE